MCVFVYHQAEIRQYNEELYVLNITRAKKITRDKIHNFNYTFLFFEYSYKIAQP